MSGSPKYVADTPLHVGIIMDGNGRWAKARHRPRLFGHREGVKTVRRVVEDAADIGIKYLTLYSFSTENWTRPRAEIAALFNLLKEFVESDLASLDANNVCVRILGSREGLQDDILRVIDKVEDTTKKNTEFYLNIAFNYGGRDEILRAFKRAEIERGSVADMSADDVRNYLDTRGLPDPDVIIRTSGEMRISNFLMWQAAYAEFVFTDVLWPDFNRSDLLDALDIFKSRDRRFGSLTDAEVA